MKEYPEIDYWNRGIFGEHVIGFNKLDGSNIRVEWDRRTAKKSAFNGGFRKFGTRTQLISKTSQHFGDSVDLFLDKYADGLNELFFKDKYFRNIDQVTLFNEYFGEHSFAGWHDLTEPKDIVLFDVIVYKKGFIPPKQFIELFGHLSIPEVIYDGNYNHKLIEDIRNNEELKEGIVCKGVRKTKGQDIVWMTKIKTNIWLTRLKGKYGEAGLLKEMNNDKQLVESLSL